MDEWLNNAIPGAKVDDTVDDQDQPWLSNAVKGEEFTYGDAFRRGLKGAEVVGQTVAHGYGGLLDAGVSGNNVSGFLEENLVNSVNEYNQLPSDPSIGAAVSAFSERHSTDVPDLSDEDIRQIYDTQPDKITGRLPADKIPYDEVPDYVKEMIRKQQTSPQKMANLIPALIAGGSELDMHSIPKLITSEIPSLIMGGGIGGKIGKELGKQVGNRVANESAKQVINKTAIGAGVQTGSVAQGSFAPNLAENISDGQDVDQAVSSAGIQSGVEALVNAPAGALTPFKLGSTGKNAVTQATAQSVAAGTGVVAGAEAVGKEVESGEVALEMLVGTVTLPIEMGIGRILAAKNNGVPVEEVTPEMEAGTPEEQVRDALAEVQRVQDITKMTPDQVATVVDQVTGVDRPPAIDRNTVEGQQQIADTEAQLGEVFARAPLDSDTNVDNTTIEGDTNAEINTENTTDTAPEQTLSTPPPETQRSADPTQGATREGLRDSGVDTSDIAADLGGEVNPDVDIKAEKIFLREQLGRKKGDQVAQFIQDNAPDAAHRAMASFVSKQIKKWAKQGVTFEFESSRGDVEGVAAKNTLSVKDLDPVKSVETTSISNESIVYRSGHTYETALHELVHGVTQAYTTAGRLPSMKGTELAGVVSDIDKVLVAARNKLNKMESAAKKSGLHLSEFEWRAIHKHNNAIKNADELLAWTLTNKDMQKFMESTPYKNGESYWTFFVDTMRKLLGMPASQHTALSEVLKLTQKLSKQDKKQTISKIKEAHVAGDLQKAMDEALRGEVSSADVVAGKANAESAKQGETQSSSTNESAKKIVEEEARSFRNMADELVDTAEGMKEAVGGISGKNRATKRNLAIDAWRHTLASLDGNLRSLVSQFKGDLIQSIPAMFHAQAGKSAGTPRTFDEALQARNIRLGAVDKIVSFMRDNGIKSKKQQAQVIKLVENPRTTRRGAMGKAAAEIETFLKKELDYLREAGVDVGEVPDGYFPREIDSGKAQIHSEEFITQATKAYEDTGLKKDDATQAAVAYWESVVYGVSGKPGDKSHGSQTPNFVQGRVFSKAAAAHLDKFRLKDIDTVLGQYVMRAGKRAETARRFGDKWSKWADMEKQMVADDPDVRNILPELRDLVALSTGVKLHTFKHGTANALSMVRTATTLATLAKSATPSLGELVMAPLRGATGKIPGDVAVQVANLWEHMHNTGRMLSGLGRSERLQQGFDLAEDVGVIAGTGHNSLMAARFAGGDPVGRLQSKVLAGFFRKNMLEYLTNYTRVTSMRMAQVFMRRLANQMQTNPTNPSKFLRELGIPKGKEKAFSDWLLKTEDGLPGAGVTGEFRDIYRTGLQRFVDQSVMRPSVSTRPVLASNPLGAVAFQLQSFGFTFHKNVINRQLHIIKDLEGLEKLAYSASLFSGMALLVGMQGAIRYMRDEVYDSDINDRKSDAAFVEGAVSQAGLFGVADPVLQSLSGIRYQKSVTSILLGPGIGGIVSSIDAAMTAALNNSDNTNTAEHNLAKAVYDWLVEPVLQAGVAMTPGGPISGKLGSLATIYLIPKGRDPFADVIAGERKERKKRPIKSTIEWLLEDDTEDKSDNSSLY